jgi:nucleoside 2-deoxyribosyltransferase
MKIYVAGPMTNMPNFNFPAFHAMAARLRAAGHQVENPAEINPDPCAEWTECMFADLKAISQCDAIVMLPGWEQSPGAQIERLWATRTGKAVYCAMKLHEVPA